MEQFPCIYEIIFLECSNYLKYCNHTLNYFSDREPGHQILYTILVFLFLRHKTVKFEDSEEIDKTFRHKQ